MADEYRLVCPAAANSTLVLPPNGSASVFDEQGISETVSEETYTECLTIPGFSPLIPEPAPASAKKKAKQETDDSADTGSGQ